MAKKTSKNTAFILLLIVAFVAAILYVGLGTYSDAYTLPADYVTNLSSLHIEGSFVKSDVVRYPTKANVTAPNPVNGNISVGVAAQTYELNFGNIPQTVLIRKFIKIGNNEETPVKICLLSRGNASEYISFTQGTQMVLPAKQSADIEIMYNASKPGIYGGEIDVVVRKPKYDFGGFIMGLIRC